MRCDICGSKKNVRIFYAPTRQRFYKECRTCFLKAMRLGALTCRHTITKQQLEQEWQRGLTVMP